MAEAQSLKPPQRQSSVGARSLMAPDRSVEIVDEEAGRRTSSSRQNENAVGGGRRVTILAPPSPDTAKTTPTNTADNTTKIERLVDKIQERRAKRMVVTYTVRKSFFEMCQECATNTAGPQNVIPFADLVKLKESAEEMGDDKDPDIYKVLELAVQTCEEVGETMFHFHEFCEYGLSEKKSITGRYPLLGAFFCVLSYYFFSAVVFCGIIRTNSTCPSSDDDDVGYYGGWLTSLYFASSTISTVGYGDVSLAGSGTENWRMAVGTVYMIVAMVIAVTVFSALSESVVEYTGLTDSKNISSPVVRFLFSRVLERANNEKNDLKYRVKLLKAIRVFELFYYFLSVNVFGMLFARFIFAVGGDDTGWTWMTTFYWAVQTTTTIGYGDLDMPFDLRWFNLFFTIIGTTFAASILGSLASLSSDLSNMKRFYAWKNREVSTRLIADLEGDDDGELDEYEFLVGSLVMLDKISKEEVKEIMDKFRQLAGDDHRINKEDIERHNYAVFSDASAVWRKNSTSVWDVLPGVSFRGGNAMSFRGNLMSFRGGDRA